MSLAHPSTVHEPHTTGILARVSDQDLDLAEHLVAVESPHCGAISTFIGQVRDHDPDVQGRVINLEYTAHPDAEHILAKIVARFATDSIHISISHRIGMLAVGDYALVACVSSAHRAAAFEVCRALVEAVKVELPVWKRQLTDDGNHNWVGLT